MMEIFLRVTCEKGIIEGTALIDEEELRSGLLPSIIFKATVDKLAESAFKKYRERAPEE